MPRSLAVYTSNGKQRDYSVPFTYIKREYVRVIGTQFDEKGRRIGSGVPLDFTWINNGLVRLNKPYPAGGRVSIERWTYAESSLVDYQGATTVTEEDLDLGDRQGLHVGQEARDRLEGVNVEIEALRERDDELEDRIEEIDRLRLPRHHASQHFATGDDPIPPAAIGALTSPPDDGKAYLATGLGWLEYIHKESDGTGARVVVQAHRFSSDGVATSFPVHHTLNSENVAVQTFDADTGERVYFGERVDGVDCVTLTSGAPLPAGKTIRVLLFAPGDGNDGGGTSDHAELTNRDAADQHPQSAITGLADDLEEIRSALDDKADEADMLARLQTKANAASLAGKADVGHTHAAATAEAAGFLSAADKAKLDGLDAGSDDPTVPVGAILPFAGPYAPTGYLFCDGALYAKADWPELYAAIGDAWKKTGDADATKFRLPDMRGRTAVGVGQGDGLTGRLLGDKGGEEAHVLTITEMPSHDHPLNMSGVLVATGPSQGAASYAAGSLGSAKATGGNAAHNTMQPFAAVNFIIKAKTGGVGV